METLRPFFVPKPWGGDFIARHFGLSSEKIGEALVLSTLKGHETMIAGKTLSTFLGHELPYLIKIIDAVEPLSIQVHPNDHWAKELENSRGKSECWLVLSAAPGASVYLGLKHGVQEMDLRTALQRNTEVQELMEFYPVKAGDFISVPAGAIHAIGAGVTILEVQQCSGITYRLWDWGRTDRELHIEKGLRVSDFSLRPGIISNVFQDPASRSLLRHPDFEVQLNRKEESGWVIDLKTLEITSPERAPSTNYIFVK